MTAPQQPEAQPDQLDEEVLEVLSSLILFKNRADARGWRDAFENMPIYLEVRPPCAEQDTQPYTSSMKLCAADSPIWATHWGY
jgi:hypothetical protein